MPKWLKWGLIILVVYIGWRVLQGSSAIAASAGSVSHT